MRGGRGGGGLGDGKNLPGSLEGAEKLPKGNETDGCHGCVGFPYVVFSFARFL